MTTPHQGAQPDTVQEVAMSDTGAVAPGDISVACEAAVSMATSHREQAGRPAGL